MAKATTPFVGYIVGSHHNHKYHQVYIQPITTVGTATSKEKRSKLTLGKLEDKSKFVPNNRFRLMPIEERLKLIWPNDWDLSAVELLNGGIAPRRIANLRKLDKAEYTRRCPILSVQDQELVNQSIGSESHSKKKIGDNGMNKEPITKES